MICEWCGETLSPATTGRPRKFCSASHRQRSFTERSARHRILAVASESVNTPAYGASEHGVANLASCAYTLGLLAAADLFNPSPALADASNETMVTDGND